jgi:hypothetical protein
MMRRRHCISDRAIITNVPHTLDRRRLRSTVYLRCIDPARHLAAKQNQPMPSIQHCRVDDRTELGRLQNLAQDRPPWVERP